MARRDAVLRPRRAHPYHFLRAQVGGDERQPADPCWQRPPRLEEVLARLHEALQRKADAQHKDEVQQHDQPINECQIQWIPPSPSPSKVKTTSNRWKRGASAPRIPASWRAAFRPCSSSIWSRKQPPNPITQPPQQA